MRIARSTPASTRARDRLATRAASAGRPSRDEEIDRRARAPQSIGDEQRASLAERDEERRALEDVLRREQRVDGLVPPSERVESLRASRERAPFRYRQQPLARGGDRLVEAREGGGRAAAAEEHAPLELEPGDALGSPRLAHRGPRRRERARRLVELAVAKRDAREVAERGATHVRVGAALDGDGPLERRSRVLVGEQRAPADVVRRLRALARRKVAALLELAQDGERFVDAPQLLHHERGRVRALRASLVIPSSVARRVASRSSASACR